MAIRKFLRLDKTTIEFDNNVMNDAGLIITERNDFMTIKKSGCFGQEIIHFNHFTGDSHNTHDLNY